MANLPFFMVTNKQDYEFLNYGNFQKDAVRYNMFYDFISRSHLSIKARDNSCIAMKNKEDTLWLWADETIPQKNDVILADLALYLKDEAIESLFAAPGVAASFASKYSGLSGRRHELYGSLTAYRAAFNEFPSITKGCLVRPSSGFIPLLAGYFVEYYRETFGLELNFQTQLKNVGGFIKADALYCWQTDKDLVAMGILTPYPEKFARLNYIYVSPSHRGRGYGKALTVALAAIAFQKGLVPVLYADQHNLAANKLYTSLKYIDSGRIDEIRFI